MWRDKTLPSLAPILDPVSFTFQIEEAFERLPGFKNVQVMEFRYISSSETCSSQLSPVYLQLLKTTTNTMKVVYSGISNVSFSFVQASEGLGAVSICFYQIIIIIIIF